MKEYDFQLEQFSALLSGLMQSFQAGFWRWRLHKTPDNGSCEKNFSIYDYDNDHENDIGSKTKAVLSPTQRTQ